MGKRKLPKELTTVTSLSKTLAMICFIVFPFLGFFLGMNYQRTIDQVSQQSNMPPIMVRKIPTPTQAIAMSSWKTYSNPNLGYSFQYPSNYSFMNEGGTTIAIVSPLNSDRTKGYELQNGELKVEIGAIAPSFTGTIDDYIQQNPMYTKKVLTSGLTVAYHAVTPTSGTVSDNETYIFFNNTNAMILNKYPFTTTRQPEFNQILSTFTFTNQNQIVTPTCMPRPACLDATPRCLMPEPAQGWCTK